MMAIVCLSQLDFVVKCVDIDSYIIQAYLVIHLGLQSLLFVLLLHLRDEVVRVHQIQTHLRLPQRFALLFPVQLMTILGLNTIRRLRVLAILLGRQLVDRQEVPGGVVLLFIV
jgi:hypothetical protein